jgi:hypothetical protein
MLLSGFISASQLESTPTEGCTPVAAIQDASEAAASTWRTGTPGDLPQNTLASAIQRNEIDTTSRTV